MIKKRLNIHCFLVMVHVIVAAFKRLSNKHCSEIRKNVSLEECHQDFNKIYEYRKCNRKRGKTPARNLA